MAFRLRNASSSFQHMIDESSSACLLLPGLPTCCKLLSWGEHHPSLRTPSISELSSIISGTLAWLSIRRNVLSTFPRLQKSKTCRSSLHGMVNFYWRFLPNAAHTLLPLTDCLQGSNSASSPVSWTPLMTCAFLEAKSDLVNCTRLPVQRNYVNP